MAFRLELTDGEIIGNGQRMSAFFGVTGDALTDTYGVRVYVVDPTGAPDAHPWCFHYPWHRIKSFATRIDEDE